MRARITLAVIATLAALLMPAQRAASLAPGRGAQESRITLLDAEILAYLVPAAAAVRKAGYDVVLTRIPWGRGFYAFHLDGTNPPPPEGGSVTVGNVAVNRRTGQVWDLDTDRAVTTPEILGVIKIIRRARGITPALVRRFGSPEP